MLGQLQAVSIKTIRMLPGGGMVFMRKPTRHQLRETAYLDGLRGVAAFMVYVYHMSLRHYPAISSWYGRGPDNYQMIRLPFLRYVSCFLPRGHKLVTMFGTDSRQGSLLLRTVDGRCLFRHLWLRPHE